MAIRPDIKPIADSSAGVALLERVRKGIENHVACQWPGSGDDESGRFVMVPLLCDELQESYAAAWQRFSGELGLAMNAWVSDDFFAELAIQVLARAMRDPSDETRKRKLFANADQLRKSVRAAERDELSLMYQKLVDDVDPDPHLMTDERFAEIESYIKKKDAVRLSGISSKTLALYIIGMGAQRQS